MPIARPVAIFPVRMILVPGVPVVAIARPTMAIAVPVHPSVAFAIPVAVVVIAIARAMETRVEAGLIVADLDGGDARFVIMTASAGTQGDCAQRRDSDAGEQF